MFAQFAFAFTYAARNLRRNLRWTLFAVFCIGAGVAAVVALRTLGLAIGDTLISTARTSNKGDVAISSTRDSNFLGALGDADAEPFTAAQVEAVRAYAAEADATLTLFTTVPNTQITRIDEISAGRPQFVSVFLIDPATFPPTEPIRAVEPAGAVLADLLTDDRAIVISRNLADQQAIRVGDQVRVSRTTEVFTVRGIISTDQEASLTNLFAAFFGFAYLPAGAADALGIEPLPNQMALTFTGPDAEMRRFTVQGDLLEAGVFGEYTLLDDVLRRNSVIADVIGRFIVVMGLGALLIGGVGNINTMLVLVGRRTNEIAALKTFGLKGRQIALLFFTEAFLLGVLGSLVGCALGVVLSIAVNGYGETFLQQRLAFAIYPEAIGFGLALGIVVSVVFGLLPVMIANRVRPAAVLRPNETQIPRAGCLQQLVLLAVVVLVIGAIAGQILGNLFVGWIGVALTLVLFGVLVGLLWVVVWLVSKLPAFRSVDLRLALRNLSVRRVRTATTLLALSGGMFALSAITFVGVGTREILQFQLVNGLGGNVLVFPAIGLAFGDFAQNLLTGQLDALDGIESRTRIDAYGGRLVAIDGLEPSSDLPFADQMPERAQRNLNTIALQTRQTVGERPPGARIVEGRALTPEDEGQPLLVISESVAEARVVRSGEDGAETVEPYRIAIGSVLTLRFGGQTRDYTVVGIVESTGGAGAFASDTFYAPFGSIPDEADFTFNVLNVAPENLNAVLLDLSTLPLTFSLDITFIDGLISRLIQQFSAIPTVVGLLSLLAAAVTMANTVSLAVLERRRSIGVLKAVGLKSRRVLWIMLLENTIIGVLGGVLGIGLSALGVAIMTALGQGEAVPIPRDALPVAVALMFASVAIAWVATFLSARPAANENVQNVLRYE